ncbi:MAG: type II toxin-antitoxin system RelE/ParE family toxin [Syntrophomonadaceae bacterium]|nr:type II toxin-antitoxin system RelE/ParE family toxin [Syntrophomonadaceae bacterium]
MPVKEFIDRQPTKAKVKILRNLQLLSEFGPGIGYPFVSNIGDNLWELRTVFQNNQYRILFSVVSGHIILLVHGLHKKTQKLPNKDLNIAYKRLKNYISRGGSH